MLKVSVDEAINATIKGSGLASIQELEKTSRIFRLSRFYYITGGCLLTDNVYDNVRHSLINTLQEIELKTEGSYAEFYPELAKAKECTEQNAEMDDFSDIVKTGITLGINPEVMKKLYFNYRVNVNKEKAIASELEYKKFCDRVITVNGTQYSIDNVGDLVQDIAEEDPPKSIRPLESLAVAYSWFQAVQGKELCFSLKIDGINIRMIYVQGHLVGAITRGRTTGEIRDYISTLFRKVPWYLEDNGQPVNGIVRGECYVDQTKLEYLREHYKSEYVVPRTAAITMLSTQHLESDYEFLKFTCFNALSGGKLDERIDKMHDKGFDTVPYFLERWNGGDYAAFTTWITEILDNMWFIGEMSGIKSDGVVVELNNSSDYEQMIKDGMYNDGNIALKVGKWAPGVYKAVLENILITRKPASYQYSVKGKIKPVKIQSGITVNIVNLFNMGLVTEYNLKPGDELFFLFKNDNAIQWVYGFSMKDTATDALQKTDAQEVGEESDTE